MELTFILNGKKYKEKIEPDMLLIDLVRSLGCKSVKRGCETSCCGLCTVFMDDVPVLSCSVPAARAEGHTVTTLEGLQDEAADLAGFIADQGAEQCGFCNPGTIMNAIALFRENPFPDENEIREYLAGNLCRCSGYEGQLRGLLAFVEYKKQKAGLAEAEQTSPETVGEGSAQKARILPETVGEGSAQKAQNPSAASEEGGAQA